MANGASRSQTPVPANQCRGFTSLPRQATATGQREKISVSGILSRLSIVEKKVSYYENDEYLSGGHSMEITIFTLRVCFINLDF